MVCSWSWHWRISPVPFTFVQTSTTTTCSGWVHSVCLYNGPCTQCLSIPLSVCSLSVCLYSCLLMSFYVSKWFTCAHSAMCHDRLIASWFFYLKCEYAPWAWLSPDVRSASQNDSHHHRHGPLLERLEQTDSLRVNWVSLSCRRNDVCLSSTNVTSTFDHFCMLLSQKCVWLHRVFDYTECLTTQCLTTQSVWLHRAVWLLSSLDWLCVYTCLQKGSCMLYVCWPGVMWCSVT